MTAALTIRDDIEALILEFARLNDAGQYEALVQRFTPDGIFIRPSAPDQPLLGQAAILQALQARATTPGLQRRHCISDITITAQTTGHIETSCVSLLLQHTASGDTSVTVGGFHDLIVRTDQGWRFARRAGFAITPTLAYHAAPHSMDWRQLPSPPPHLQA